MDIRHAFIVKIKYEKSHNKEGMISLEYQYNIKELKNRYQKPKVKIHILGNRFTSDSSNVENPNI